MVSCSVWEGESVRQIMEDLKTYFLRLDIVASHSNWIWDLFRLSYRIPLLEGNSIMALNKARGKDKVYNHTSTNQG